MFVAFTKYALFAKFYIEKTFFTKKKTLRRQIYMKMLEIYISFEKYIFIQKMFVLQIKYKSFLNVYLFCKKKKTCF